MRRMFAAIITCVLLSVPAMAQSQNNDPWSIWIAATEKSINVKVDGLKVLKTQRDSACSRESQQIDKDACRDFYNGIIKRAESEKGRLEAMVKKAKTLPVSERGQLAGENAEYNRGNALTDGLYLAVVTVYPPVKQQAATTRQKD